GDREAVPIVIRRIAAQLNPPMRVHILPPIRIPKKKLLKRDELEKAVELAARKVANHGAILIVLDSDDDCPAKFGPALLQRANTVRSDIPCAVVLAKREFESWFLAAAESLRGRRGLPADLAAPADPEAIQGVRSGSAIGWQTVEDTAKR